VAFWRAAGFTNLISRCSSNLERLHDLITVWLFIIFVVVLIVAFSVFVKAVVALTPDSVILEAAWTFVPMLILVRIAFPRIHLLCLQDSLCLTPTSTIKVNSNQ
jgi:heme/copper-type cytochrome/quinol oxidase subunit 2